MSKVLLGNHTAVVVARADRERIRQFYCDVLGAEVLVAADDVDRLQLGDVHICLIYQDNSLDASGFLRSIWLELKTDDVEQTKRRILECGATKLDVPDPHLYFQAPGGQVFRLVGIDEDLSVYERSTSTRPRQ
jgi:catechol 2,3-dioxygenase-like lactoylglutathione lyase family enzyme